MHTTTIRHAGAELEVPSHLAHLSLTLLMAVVQGDTEGAKDDITLLGMTDSRDETFALIRHIVRGGVACPSGSADGLALGVPRCVTRYLQLRVM